MKTILVFFDGSASARRAFDLGLDIAVKFRAKLLVVSVLPAAEVEAMLDRGEDYDVGELRHLCEEASNKGVSCRYQPEVGDRAAGVIRAAEACNADLVVIGRAGSKETTEQATDSALLEILREARCPVTVINQIGN